MAKVSKKAEQVKSFIVFDIFEKAVEMIHRGERPIMLAVGEPDFSTPKAIVDAAEKALRSGKTRYVHSLGLKQLREAIADKYYRNYKVEVDPSNIIVTAGTSPAMNLLFSAILEPGEEVILPNPYYPCYPNFIQYAGGKVVLVDVMEEEGFQYRPEDVAEKISDKTAAVMINSPGNPTGTLMPQETMREIADMGVTIISDEIYHGLVYEGRERSILEFTKDAFVLNGFSKLYAMTGWRIGYIIAPENVMPPLWKIQQNFQISVADFIQWAALAALTEPSVEEDIKKMRETFNKRRKYMMERLIKMGFGVATPPTGAFYVFANAKKFTTDSYSFVFEMLDRAKVGVTPGIDFGPGGEGYLRFSYATSMENIEKGLDRVEKYIKNLGPA